MRARSEIAALTAAVVLTVTTAPAQQALVQAKPEALTIVVVRGENQQNNIRTRTAEPPVVEVRDAAEKPVAGAEVVFLLPYAGPGATFDGWLNTQTVRTDETGRATARNFAPNDQEGRFNIKVTASHAGQTGTVVIPMVNVAGTKAGGSGPSRKKLWTILAIGAGAAIGGGIAASRNGNDSAPTLNPVTVTPGPITVGSPR
ncbi:MAG: hypothetical protein HYZ57_09055 [Acidobacteria bacterium]|nr:hypothetical protein [Acidobacteriota bacterium]